MTRTRIREDLGNYDGIRYRSIFGTVVVNEHHTGSFQSSYDSCSDLLGPGVDHPLNITHLKNEHDSLNGTTGSPSTVYAEYSNYVPGFFRTITGHLVTNEPSEGSSMADILASTNPSRADISVPTFIAELKDLPHMIRQVGDVFRTVTKGRFPSASQAGGWYLGYRFGVAPLVSDLRKLMDFQSRIDKRLRELNQLYENGGLKRTRKQYSQVVDSASTLTIESSLGTVCTCRAHTITEVKRWSTVRWKPTAPLPNYTDYQKRAYALSLIFGLNPQDLISTAWEILPWSWLIDWCVNVQDLIEANKNTVPATPASQCVMTHKRTTRTFTRNNSNWVSGGNCTQLRETKQRYLGGTSLNSSLPLFSGSQLSILGALAVQRFRR